MKPSKNNLHHLFHSFRSMFLFSSVMYLQYTPSSQRNLYSKIKDKSEAVYFFQVSIYPHKVQIEKKFFHISMNIPEDWGVFSDSGLF